MQTKNKPNGALNEAMEIIKDSLADNSQVEQPYRTNGKIFSDENGKIISVYIKGIIVDFETCISVDESIVFGLDDMLRDSGWQKVVSENGDIEDWIIKDTISSLEWDGKERNYFDF